MLGSIENPLSYETVIKRLELFGTIGLADEGFTLGLLYYHDLRKEEFLGF